MSTPCEKHALLPAIGQSPCAGCEIERLRAENDRLVALLECARGDCRQSMKMAEKLEQQSELYQQVQRAAGELPIGWEIRICIERDAGYAELWDGDGCEVDFPNSCESLAETVSEAIGYATGKE